MRRFRTLVVCTLLHLLSGCGDAANPLAPGLPVPPEGGTPHPDLALFGEAARGAWLYVEQEYQAETGFVNAVAGYPYTTIWDVASGLAALFSARELGLLGDAEYHARTSRALATLRSAPLSHGVAFNKNYDTRTGSLVGVTDGSQPAADEIGWSTTDIGRLLIWLRIIADAHPQHRPAAEAIAARLDYSRLIENGYLVGAGVDGKGELTTGVEGRIGYEQYAAYGFALWGQRAERALRLHENTLPIEIWEIPLVADRRGYDPLTSEPFVLMGLELGWTAEVGELARNVLRVQEERHRRSGIVTIVSEDAVPVPPHYFYYYAINYQGQNFVPVAADGLDVLDWPRWVSTKAAYGWHALLPGEYTSLAVESVAPARNGGRGWASGVYEGSGESTGSFGLNTAAVVLEAAVYAKRGRGVAYGE